VLLISTSSYQGNKRALAHQLGAPTAGLTPGVVGGSFVQNPNGVGVDTAAQGAKPATKTVFPFGKGGGRDNQLFDRPQ
jgi:hypothetical protein